MSGHLLGLSGIDVNEVDSEGRTALYYAAAYNCKEVVAVLLDQAADVNALVDRWGHTALQIVVDHNDGGVVKLLLDTPGTDLNAICNDGTTALRDSIEPRLSGV